MSEQQINRYTVYIIENMLFNDENANSVYTQIILGIQRFLAENMIRVNICFYIGIDVNFKLISIVVIGLSIG